MQGQLQETMLRPTPTAPPGRPRTRPALRPLLAIPVAILVAALLSACTPRLEFVGVANPEVPVAEVEGASLHRIHIMTTREATDVVGALFSELRADELGFASVTVSVPPTHVTGALEYPARLPPDPRTEFAIVDPTVYADDRAFLASIDAALRPRPPLEREVLFFVHGYNMTTSDAILQVGQFVEDSGFEGVPVLFTWASAARLSRYVYDLNSALVARPLLIEAAAVMSRSSASDYHLFAHSMGALLTMESLVDMARSGTYARADRLRNVVLASPDIDLDLFRTQVAQLDRSADRLSILLSRDDYALRVSRLIAGGVPRLGAAEIDALEDLGVTAIDLSEVDDSLSGSHSKFTGSPEIVRMIGDGLRRAPDYGSRPQTELDEILGDLQIRVVGPGLGQ